MKRQWDSEELVEHFTLLPDESILLDNLSGSNRLGFTLLLKFFQIEARFPISKQEIPKSVVSYIAKQVDVSPRAIKEYSFSGRTIERHRSQIRQFFGFRETTVEDAFELTKWLQEKVLAYDCQESHLEAAAYQRLRSLKLEPPSPDRIERLIRSAVRTCEETFCSTIFEQLSSQTLIKLDALLRTDGALEDEQSQLQQSDFNVLKTDPGRTSLDSILKEAQKLNCIRQLGLPSNLFALVSPKVVYHYRRRASAEPPRELRRHPDPIRYTLVAAFCWQRSQEITDSLVELLIQIIHRIGINAERRVDKDGQERVNRVNYEICVLQALRDRLRSKEIWVVGAKRYCNPEEDLPQDFESQRETYYQALKQPLDAEAFISQLQQEMKVALAQLDEGLANNEQVRILKKNNGWISVSPFVAQPEPLNLLRLKGEIGKRWPMTSLLDVFKEADLRIQFTEQFKSVASREMIDRSILQKRLLLCLYGLGTNTGLKRICAGIERENYTDLQYVKKRFIHKEHLRNAIATVVNEIFRVRMTHIWGEGTTACASDSKKFGSWNQNLMTEWHIRYGGRGVMIYWHVEKKSACIYSQLKTCSSSEVAAMIEGLLHHCTDMKVQKNYVDTHGQSEIAFAFCRLLGFELLPRLKRIHEQKLYRPTTGHNDAYPNLQPVLTRAIDWELIRQQYDQMVKYATALRLGTALI